MSYWEIQEYKIWKGVDPVKPQWRGINLITNSPDYGVGHIQYLERNSPEKLFRLMPVYPQDAPPFTHLHVKSRHNIRLLGIGNAQCAVLPINEMDTVMIYEHDGRFWVRHADEFNDGRFQPL